LNDKARSQYLRSLSKDELDYALQFGWFWLRDEQVAPQGDWRIWLFLGGRGAGKTLAGANFIAESIELGHSRNVGVIGATFNDTRAVMVEGPSGLMKLADQATFEPSNRRIVWPSGARATVLSADEPDSLRGHQFDALWLDEFCKWPDPQGALDMALMCLRLGSDPRMAITTTPRAIESLKVLMHSQDVALTKSTTDANAANLAPGFLETMRRRYAGSRLGRQELDAEIIDDNDAALWKRSWIDDHRVREAPELSRIVVAVDPPASTKGDECGIVVAGVTDDKEAYVLADCSADGLTPAGWAKRVADAFERYEADTIVAEANQGGDMVRAVLNEAMPGTLVKLVRATRGKRVRASPYAVPYETGRVHHVGSFASLEDQMCNYDGTGESPDRMDALVWALAELIPPIQRREPKVRTI
jgi:phage terminase large subunit-like protein